MKSYFIIVTVVSFLLFSKVSDAQYMNNTNSNSHSASVSDASNSGYHLRDHLFVGGFATLEFGAFTALGAQPFVGYKFDKNLAVGIGANYLYLNGILDAYNIPYATTVYGGDVFARYKVYNNIFAYGEYGFTNYETPAIDINNNYLFNYRISVPDLLIGGGYSQQMGRNSYFEILVLYDVLYGPYSYEPSPLVIRPGFVFGF